jgi:hypothetical protein
VVMKDALVILTSAAALGRARAGAFQQFSRF